QGSKVTGVRRGVAGGRIAGVRWRVRPDVQVADREWAQGLWVAAMPWWPLLPAGIAMIADGLVAEAGPGPVGLAASAPRDDAVCATSAAEGGQVPGTQPELLQPQAVVLLGLTHPLHTDPPHRRRRAGVRGP